MKNIVVKNPFLDKEDGGKKRKFGEKLLVTLQRAQQLIGLGFAVAATIEEAKEIMKQEPKTVAVFKEDQVQWAEPVEINSKKATVPVKATKKARKK